MSGQTITKESEAEAPAFAKAIRHIRRAGSDYRLCGKRASGVKAPLNESVTPCETCFFKAEQMKLAILNQST